MTVSGANVNVVPQQEVVPESMHHSRPGIFERLEQLPATWTNAHDAEELVSIAYPLHVAAGFFF